MRTCMQEIASLLKARIQCIWIDTYEEQAVLDDLKEILIEMENTSLYSWSIATGLTKHAITELDRQEAPNKAMGSPGVLFEHINKEQNGSAANQGVYVLLDYHSFSQNAAAVRALRDLKEYPPYRSYNPVIVVSPIQDIAQEHEKLFTIVQYELPNRCELETELNKVASMIKRAVDSGKNLIVPEESDITKLSDACIGLTLNEVHNACAKSLVKYRELSVRAIADEKMQLVKKSGVLDYIQPQYTMEDIGGNKAFKEWLQEIRDCYTEEAAAFGVKPSKGYMAFGIPGASKSVSAEAVASMMGWPLLSLAMNRIMDKHVGASEKRIDQALRIAKACAPCVFLWDEVEKMLGGIASSNGSDSGTLARVVGKCLQFLNEDNNVFVVMTSNDVSQLPPELTRSGRLDTQWYFSLPSQEEREEIFRIHFKRAHKEISDELIKFAAKEAEHYTGAEIRDIVKFGIRKAFRRSLQDGNKEILQDDIRLAVGEVIPLARSSKEKIDALESYAKGRARYAHAKNRSSFNEDRDARLKDKLLQLR